MKSVNTDILGQTHRVALSLLMIIIEAFDPMVPMTTSNASSADSLETDFWVYHEPPLQPLPSLELP